MGLKNRVVGESFTTKGRVSGFAKSRIDLHNNHLESLGRQNKCGHTLLLTNLVYEGTLTLEFAE